MKTVKLGDLVEISIGRTPARGEAKFWDINKNTDNIWLSIADMPSRGKYVSESKEYISDEAASNFSIVPKGTLLVSFKLTLGRLAFASCDLRTNEAIAALKNDETRVLSEYLYHYLKFFDWNHYAAADKKVKGLTLNKAKVANIPISFPESLAEQRRVVERLDGIFAQIDRASVLLEENIANTNALKQSLLAQAFDADSATHTHRLAPLGEICRVLGGKRLPKGEKLIDIRTTHPYIRVTDFDGNGGVDTTGLKYITNTVYEKISRYIIESTDVFLSIAGTIGVTGVIPDELDGANLTENACRLVPSEKISRDYLYYFTISDSFRTQSTAEVRQSAQPKLALTRIKGIRITLPDLVVQNKVVAKIKGEFDKVDQLNILYNKKLNRLAELRQSVLAEAFSVQ